MQTTGIIKDWVKCVSLSRKRKYYFNFPIAILSSAEFYD
jgi:hypothetical protein